MPRVVLAASCFRGDWARETYRLHPDLFRGKDVVCEDLPLTLGLLLQGPIYFSQNNFLIYRVLDKSLSHSDSRNDYMKGFAYSAFRQTLNLATALGVPVQQIKPYALGKAGDFALHAFLNKDREFMADVLNTLTSKALQPTFKQRLLRLSMTLPPIAAVIRSLYSKKKGCP
jgi:hypothetical protein